MTTSAISNTTTSIWQVTKNGAIAFGAHTKTFAQTYIWPALVVIGKYGKKLAILLYEHVKKGCVWAWGHTVDFAKTNPIGFKVAVISAATSLILGLLIGRYCVPKSRR